MRLLLKNVHIYDNGVFRRGSVAIDGGSILGFDCALEGAAVLDFGFSTCYVFPGFADVHVHLREPGFSYKETILTGTKAAARGGFAHVGAMPNVNPAPDRPAHLQLQADLIAKQAVVNVYPYGTITAGQEGKSLSEMEAIAPYVLAFSDDGKGVQSAKCMEAAMAKAKSLGKIIAAHCEDNRFLNGGCIHDGAYARQNNLRGIPSQSEWRQVRRDLQLAEKTGCAYHVCHVSCKESVELIRQAKQKGIDVTCETAPHYLIFDDSMLENHGRFKMNPPIRSRADRKALIDGLLDGTIEMIATDHAPHAPLEKNSGLAGSANGIVGLETAFPVLYTELVRTGVLTLEKLVSLLYENPAKRFGIGTPLAAGQPATLTVFEVDTPYLVDPDEFQSMGKSTPFEGMQVYGRCLLTLCNGKIAWKERLL